MSPIETRTVANRGGGAPPPYEWTVKVTKQAAGESKKILSGFQELHIRDQIRELARESDPTKPNSLSVDKVGEVYELREKGGPLGKINLRVFFATLSRRVMVLLGVYKKEKDGSTPPHVVLQMERRLRLVKEAHGSETVRSKKE